MARTKCETFIDIPNTNYQIGSCGNIRNKNNPNFGRTKTSVWSRSMGYIRPISNFNIGKRTEFEERKTFTEKNCLKQSCKK